MWPSELQNLAKLRKGSRCLRAVWQKEDATASELIISTPVSYKRPLYRQPPRPALSDAHARDKCVAEVAFCHGHRRRRSRRDGTLRSVRHATKACFAGSESGSGSGKTHTTGARSTRREEAHSYSDAAVRYLRAWGRGKRQGWPPETRVLHAQPSLTAKYILICQGCIAEVLGAEYISVMRGIGFCRKRCGAARCFPGILGFSFTEVC